MNDLENMGSLGVEPDDKEFRLNRNWTVLTVAILLIAIPTVFWLGRLYAQSAESALSLSDRVILACAEGTSSQKASLQEVGACKQAEQIKDNAPAPPDPVQGDPGPQGNQGKRGQSAYEFWLSQGYSGSPDEFFNFLRGPRGTTGRAGASAYEVWLAAGNSGDISKFLSALKGEPGVKGDTGDQGLMGKVGASAYEVWLDAGYTGTPETFLASLKGAPGADSTVPGPVGPAGPAGQPGPACPPGYTGSERKVVTTQGGQVDAFLCVADTAPGVP